MQMYLSRNECKEAANNFFTPSIKELGKKEMDYLNFLHEESYWFRFLRGSGNKNGFSLHDYCAAKILDYMIASGHLYASIIHLENWAFKDVNEDLNLKNIENGLKKAKVKYDNIWIRKGTERIMDGQLTSSNIELKKIYLGDDVTPETLSCIKPNGVTYNIEIGYNALYKSVVNLCAFKSGLIRVPYKKHMGEMEIRNGCFAAIFFLDDKFMVGKWENMFQH